MANQLVYYGIYSVAERRNRKMRCLDAPYECIRGDVDDHVIAVDRSFDPVEILPPELSSRCLLDALHSGTDDRLYQSNLLQMLHVSEKWCDYIISAPLLWSEIFIDCSTPDLLAMLATFTHLSGTTPLSVVIRGDPGTSWNEIGSILLPHSQRIRTLDFRPITHFHKEGRDPHLSSSKRLLGSFHYLAGLKELNFWALMDLHSFDLDLPTLPRGVLIGNPLTISPLQVDSAITSLRNYAHITTEHWLDDVLPQLCSLSAGELRIDGRIAQMSTSNIEIPLEAVSRLTGVTCLQPYSNSLVRLLRLAAHRLSYLVLRVADSDIQEIINTLSTLVKLKHLDLYLVRVEETTEKARASDTSCGAVIGDLNTLRIEGPREEGLDLLFAAFTTMYPSVRHVKLSNLLFPRTCTAYLASLAYIETLHCYHGIDPNPLYPIIPSLQSLNAVGRHILQSFELPNLLNLQLVVIQGTRFDSICRPFLRKLWIGGTTSYLDLDLEPSHYPELRMLTISHKRLRWQLSSLPNLVSITLYTSLTETHNGTILCVALLYRPGYCPALQQIWFSEPVEWDVLFLMLERRNQGTEYVSRIDTINLPFVPFTLRKPLGLLLEGRIAERPSTLELSFEGALELLCDDTIPDCWWCLRHMRPHCMELEPRKVFRPLVLGDCLADYPKPPDDVPTDIRDWISQYHGLREEWKHLQVHRNVSCRLWR